MNLVINRSSKFVGMGLAILVTVSLGALTFLSAVSHGEIKLASGKGKIILTARKSDVAPATIAGLDESLPVPSDTFFVLVIGNDYRPGVEGKRADSIHLLGINPKEKKASMINFPRDTNVAIPGHGTNKINAANAFGGSELTAKTLEQLTGVSISYTLETDFAGFTVLIDSLGGLDVNVEKAMKDSNSGSNFSPGVTHMNGATALSYSRDRHSFPIGDLQRSQNQGHLLIAALTEMQTKKNSTTSKFEAAYAITKNVQLKNLSLSDVYYLMELASDLKPADVSNITVPWAGSEKLAPKANDLFNDFKDNGIINTYTP